jgi:NADH-quinone oxidoreductase subunit G
MARPQEQLITFTIDGRQVQAPENMMLADAAKLGDVEIPVFCYEPKLGAPVGACRMCLVEIEGIPKLQTGCSTPVKDGMVVNTQSAQVKAAQRSVVEFLLINHPLDCPVCDKGGECPLQDITFGWGPGTSRTKEPKRHFKKPLELSPLVAIDRERCILCYRCARFSQEVSEDHQLVLAERGSHSYISTFDGHPYVSHFSGNIIELCPVGALTSIPYRFRARPWDIEGAGTICTLCPSQCNVNLTVRNERVLRVLARDNHAVDDGWLCDKGRFGYQSFHVDSRITRPLIRDGGGLRAVPWELALERAAELLEHAHGATCALAGGGTSNEEAHLLARLLREALASEALDSIAAVPPRCAHLLANPDLQATVADIEHAQSVLVLGCELREEAPIIELRVRKGVRRNGVKLLLGTPARSALDAVATRALRCKPGAEGELAIALAIALESVGKAQAAQADELQRRAQRAGVSLDELQAFARELAGGGEDVVVIYGQRILRTEGAAEALLGVAKALGIAPGGDQRTGGRCCGLLGLSDGVANARGVLEAGLAPGYGPGYAPRALSTEDLPADAYAIAERLAAGKLRALYLFGADPLRCGLPADAWRAALAAKPAVIAHADFLTETISEHAQVVFPTESYAEKEGTVAHPDGRLQRLRPAIARQGEVRAGWWVIAELARRLGLDLGLLGNDQGAGARALAAAGIIAEGLSAARASQLLLASVPIYSGITLERIGGKGVRWQECDGAAALAQPPAAELSLAPGRAGGAPAEPPALNAYRPLFDAPEAEYSPALRFLYRRASGRQPAPLRAPELPLGAGAANGSGAGAEATGTHTEEVAGLLITHVAGAAESEEAR